MKFGLSIAFFLATVTFAVAVSSVAHAQKRPSKAKIKALITDHLRQDAARRGMTVDIKLVEVLRTGPPTKGTAARGATVKTWPVEMQINLTREPQKASPVYGRGEKNLEVQHWTKEIQIYDGRFDCSVGFKKRDRYSKSFDTPYATCYAIYPTHTFVKKIPVKKTIANHPVVVGPIKTAGTTGLNTELNQNLLGKTKNRVGMRGVSSYVHAIFPRPVNGASNSVARKEAQTQPKRSITLEYRFGGSCDDQIVNAQLEKILSAIDKCYQEVLEKDSSAEAKFIAGLTLSKEGKVTHISTRKITDQGYNTPLRFCFGQSLDLVKAIGATKGANQCKMDYTVTIAQQ